MEPQRPVENLQGTLILKPIEAKFERSLHAFIKMDPYCVATVGATQVKGLVCKNGGLNPYWTDALMIQLRNDEPCVLQIKDRQVLSEDSIIGVCGIDLQQLFEEKNVTKWYELYYRKKPVGHILIEAIYTEENYGSRHIIYTKLKHSRPVEQPPIAAKVVEKHMPNAQDNFVLQQESMMRGSTGMRLAPSPVKEQGSGKKEISINQQISQETQGVEGLSAPANIPATTTVAQEVQNNLPPAGKPKKKKGWKLLGSIKNIFDPKSKKNRTSLPPTTDNPNNLAPLTRRKPDVGTFASVGGVPASTAHPGEGILERKKPEPPKPSLRDYLQKENLGQASINIPAGPVVQEKGFVRTLNPVVPQGSGAGDKLIDQYRSVGHQDLVEVRKYPNSANLRLPDTNDKDNMIVSDFASVERETPNWKSSIGNGGANGHVGQTQEVKPSSAGVGGGRISDLLQNRQFYNYR